MESCALLYRSGSKKLEAVQHGSHEAAKPATTGSKEAGKAATQPNRSSAKQATNEAAAEVERMQVDEVAKQPRGGVLSPLLWSLVVDDLLAQLTDNDPLPRVCGRYSNYSQRGELAEQIDDSTFCTMNDEAPTRVIGTCSSSPHITIASGGLINSITRRSMLTLALDHLPIIISIEKLPNFVSVNNRTFINFNKANWVGFTEFTESTYNALRTYALANVNSVAVTALLIPAGRIAEIRPNFPAEAAVLANERDTLRDADPGKPRIRDLNLEIWRMVNHYRRTKWIELLKSCNLSTGVNKLWATVKALSNPQRHDDRVEVQFNQIVRGLNQKPPCERTILVALDLSKPFDPVNHTTLKESPL
ncbi:PREDICTED: uncharacterized protein LOC108971477 [Bactrocera latifrons]|uniref:uncharacterized protein LOC108971477 n=1 Tax=Bactrocera latifrons TaxID=174628 RepID=UPI0008DDEEB4|nr:PREDICTED: uncharacterized protein LOC108971477 [Bactrocera latifrons]